MNRSKAPKLVVMRAYFKIALEINLNQWLIGHHTEIDLANLPWDKLKVVIIRPVHILSTQSKHIADPAIPLRTFW